MKGIVVDVDLDRCGIRIQPSGFEFAAVYRPGRNESAQPADFHFHTCHPHFRRPQLPSARRRPAPGRRNLLRLFTTPRRSGRVEILSVRSARLKQ